MLIWPLPICPSASRCAQESCTRHWVHLSFSLLLPLQDVEKFHAFSKSDWLYNMFCENHLYWKRSSLGYFRVSASLHHAEPCYLCVKSIISLTFSTELSCPVHWGCDPPGHDTVSRMGDWYCTSLMSPGMHYNRLSAHSMHLCCFIYMLSPKMPWC